MSNKSFGLSDAFHEYLLSVSLRETDVMRRLRERTAEHPKAEMQIAPEQGQFFRLLIRLMQARRTLEVGVFTGYSALSVAEALPPDGEIVACDVSEEYTAIAQEYWAEAGVADKIDLRIAPAIETLDRLLDAGEQAAFDFAFIDADKEQYDAYYERCLRLVRPGGLVALDNTFRDGRVAASDPDEEGVRAVKALNEKLHGDDRIHLSVLPVADGLTLALKK
jgi:caffeoyl-CoA O-methyltransferase